MIGPNEGEGRMLGLDINLLGCTGLETDVPSHYPVS